jgi:hypothetical protein
MSPAKQRLQNISSYQKKRERGKNGFCFEYIVALVKRYLGKYVSLCPKVYYISLVPGSKHCFLESRGQPEREKRDTNKSGAGTERLQVRFIVISFGAYDLLETRYLHSCLLCDVPLTPFNVAFNMMN